MWRYVWGVGIEGHGDRGITHVERLKAALSGPKTTENSEIKTRRIKEKQIVLTPKLFGEPIGYYSI